MLFVLKLLRFQFEAFRIIKLLIEGLRLEGELGLNGEI